MAYVATICIVWANTTTHNTVIGFMRTELIMGQKPVMPIEQKLKKNKT